MIDTRSVIINFVLYSLNSKITYFLLRKTSVGLYSLETLTKIWFRSTSPLSVLRLRFQGSVSTIMHLTVAFQTVWVNVVSFSRCKMLCDSSNVQELKVPVERYGLLQIQGAESVLMYSGTLKMNFFITNTPVQRYFSAARY